MKRKECTKKEINPSVPLVAIAQTRWTELAAAAAKSLQSCPTLCDPIDGSPPSSPVPGILQARTLEWVAISFSNAWKWKVKVKSLRRVRPSATPWSAAYQAPPSMGFSRQEYWSRVPLPSPWTELGSNQIDTHVTLPSVMLILIVSPASFLLTPSLFKLFCSNSELLVVS